MIYGEYRADVPPPFIMRVHPSIIDIICSRSITIHDELINPHGGSAITMNARNPHKITLDFAISHYTYPPRNVYIEER